MTCALAGALVLLETSGTSARADVLEGTAAVQETPPEPDPSWQVNASLSGDRYSIDAPTPGASTTGTGEDFGFGVTRFLAPLRDDGAPYSLQPFLQRASTWSLSFDGSHFSTHNAFGGPDRTNWNGAFSGSVDVYVARWLALNGGLGYSYDLLHDGTDQATHSLNGFVDVGLRVANTRFDAWLALSELDVGGASTELRRRVGASAFTEIARRLTATVSGNLIPRGEGGGVSLEYFPRRELGIFGGAFVSRGELYSDDLVVTESGGSLGVAAWLDPALGIEARYRLAIDDLPAQVVGQETFGWHEVTHDLLLAVFARFDRL